MLILICTHREDDNVGTRLVGVYENTPEGIALAKKTLKNEYKKVTAEWTDGTHSINEYESSDDCTPLMSADAFFNDTVFDWTCWQQWTLIDATTDKGQIHWF